MYTVCNSVLNTKSFPFFVRDLANRPWHCFHLSDLLADRYLELINNFGILLPPGGT